MKSSRNRTRPLAPAAGRYERSRGTTPGLHPLVGLVLAGGLLATGTCRVREHGLEPSLHVTLQVRRGRRRANQALRAFGRQVLASQELSP